MSGAGNTANWRDRWPRCKKLGLVAECNIHHENEITGSGLVALIVVFTLTLVGTIAAVATVVGVAQCAQAGGLYGYPHHWTLLSGCFLQVSPHHWVTTGNYQAFLAVKG